MNTFIGKFACRIFTTTLIVALMGILLTSAQAAPIVEDPFNYATGNLNGLGTWTSSGSQPDIVVASGNLSVSGLAASTGNKITWSGTGRNSYKPFTGPASGTIYFSLIFRANATPTAATLIASLNSASTTKRLCLHLGTDNRLGLSHNAGTVTYGGPALVNGTDYLVVGSLEIVTGSANDIYRLWVAPAAASFGGSEPAVSAQMTSTSDTTFTSARFYFQRDANTPSVEADELRVGVSWADVTPTGAPLVGAKLGFTTQPSNAAPNTVMSSVVVQVQAVDGAAVPSNNVPVTLTLSAGSGSLSGTLTQNTDASGKATFNNLSIDTVGTGKQLTATASGIGAGLTNAISASFAIATNVIAGGDGPVITRGVGAGSSFLVYGTHPTPGTFVQVLGSPDLSLPMTNWLLVNYDNFDANGNVVFTNPVSPVLTKMFYRLNTGNTGTKIEPPSIGTQPASQIVSPGSAATFSVAATGPMLQYLWYFNSNAIANATNSSLVIPNAQAGNAGNYFVIIANPAGSAKSAVVTLGVGNIAPTITLQPASQSVSAGGTAIFTVAATGTAPLTYQWYFNTNTLISGATNTLYSVAGVTTNNAGKYSVTVHNNFGNAFSTNATLAVTPPPTNLPDTNIVGYAALWGVTGGEGGTEVFTGDYFSFSNYVRQVAPMIIHVTNIITGPGPGVDQYCYVYGNNKTIIGDGTNAQLNGVDLRVNATNIIIRNLLFQITPVGTNDGITLDKPNSGTLHPPATGIWIDHCCISNAQDGAIDVTKNADWVTISWCKFLYAPKLPGSTHEFVHLIGSSDSDTAAGGVPFKVTLHHNWYADNAVERMPSVRNGRVHVFNCYYTCVGNNYCVRTRINSEVLLENSYFVGVQNPWELLTTSGTAGKLKASNNNVTGPGDTSAGNTWIAGWYPGQSLIPGTDTLTDLNPPPYAYTNVLDNAANVPTLIQSYCGPGKYPFAP